MTPLYHRLELLTLPEKKREPMEATAYSLR